MPVSVPSVGRSHSLLSQGRGRGRWGSRCRGRRGSRPRAPASAAAAAVSEAGRRSAGTCPPPAAGGGGVRGGRFPRGGGCPRRAGVPATGAAERRGRRGGDRACPGRPPRSGRGGAERGSRAALASDIPFVGRRAAPLAVAVVGGHGFGTEGRRSGRGGHRRPCTGSRNAPMRTAQRTGVRGRASCARFRSLPGRLMSPVQTRSARDGGRDG